MAQEVDGKFMGAFIRTVKPGTTCPAAPPRATEGVRSIIAEAILNKIGVGKFRGYGAGSQPKRRIRAPRLKRCSREPSPIWQPTTAHWGIADPAEAKGTAAEIALAFKKTYRLLNQRISILHRPSTALPRKLSLKNKLQQIGEMEGATTPPGRC
jgi:hypothetical protein